METMAKIFALLIGLVIDVAATVGKLVLGMGVLALVLYLAVLWGAATMAFAAIVLSLSALAGAAMGLAEIASAIGRMGEGLASLTKSDT